MRRNRKRQPTPKGEAARSLDHAKGLLKALEALSKPDQKQTFVHRLNDFLRSARTVADYLPLEGGRTAGLEAWANKEIKGLCKKDPRFDLFCRLRVISEHFYLVGPTSADICVAIGEQLVLRASVGSVQAELGDAKSGEVLADVSQAAPPGVESTGTQASISTQYFLSNWPDEDLITLCKAVVATLDSLVNEAYRGIRRPIHPWIRGLLFVRPGATCGALQRAPCYEPSLNQGLAVARSMNGCWPPHDRPDEDATVRQRRFPRTALGASYLYVRFIRRVTHPV